MNILPGLCVSGGDAKGVAHIVPDSFIITDLPKNTILIMKALDRSLLLSLTQNVVGIIAENGNIGSHGAGILRQLNIPCMVRIKDATSLIGNGDFVELRGKDNCVLCADSVVKASSLDTNEVNETPFRYSLISKETFNLDDIRPILTWYKPRPGRVYQKLRFDIIRDVYTAGAEYLYNLPPTSIRQDEDGVLEICGTPYTPDLCSFMLCNPSWLIEKAKERTIEFDLIRASLEKLLPHVTNSNIDDIVLVFRKSIELYKAIFKYVFLAQVTSDEFLDIYLDYLFDLTGVQNSKDIFSMKSDYIEKCLASGVDPGDFQRWDSVVRSPHIWYGEIDYTPFPVDDSIITAIQNSNNNQPRLLRDYHAFRIVVPLLYQLSEEFFYMSRSINTFLVWSIVLLHKQICSTLDHTISINDFYNMSLDEVNHYIDNI